MRRSAPSKNSSSANESTVNGKSSIGRIACLSPILLVFTTATAVPSTRILTEMGFANVHVEDFTVPYWKRTHEAARVVGASAQPLIITALGGSAPTPEGGLEADIVRFDILADLIAAEDADVAGKIVFIDEVMTRTQTGDGYGLAVAKRGACPKTAAAKGAVACLIRSVGTDHFRRPHTGIIGRAGPEKSKPSPFNISGYSTRE